MANKFGKGVTRNLKNSLQFLCSRRSIPMFKGTLAYILAYVVIFLRRFDDLSQFPQAFFSLMIVVVVVQPGSSVGACIQSTALSVAGISLGSLGFLILAKLNPWPVAQAFVFAFIVYVMALVKARGLRWFNFSLLCILNSFNGIFTSYALGGVFSPTMLVAYYVSYLWAAAIALGINILFLPYSAETELRQALVVSLEHLGTFAHLLAKEYTLEISAEERAVREHLSRTLRADFCVLSDKIIDTTAEINYSRFSMKSYQSFVSRTHAMQQALITAHSSLDGIETHDHDLFKKHFLPPTVVAFNHLRRAIDLTIRSIGSELRYHPMVIPATQTTYDNYMASMESQAPRDQLANQLAIVSERLTAEVQSNTVLPIPRSGTPDTRFADSSTQTRGTPSFSALATGTPHRKWGTDTHPEIEYGVQRLRMEFDIYAAVQHKLLQDVLLSGHLQGASDGNLRVYQPRASLRDTYGDHLGIDVEGDSLPVRSRQRGAVTNGRTKDEEGEKMQGWRDGTENVLGSGHSLIRVWGFIFALEQFVLELEALSSSVRPEGIEPKRRFHVHFFEVLRQKLRGEEENGLPLPEALALLEKRPYTPVKRNIWQHFEQYTSLIQGPTSVYAGKTAAAASIFAILIYAATPRVWFINYVLSPGIMTIVVALAPTLGQSMESFVLQIAGTSFGYLWALAVLEMFRNVGGYIFNPYGMICMVLPYALGMQYVLYNMPRYFVAALLGLNGLGVIISVQWVAVEYLHLPDFDTPAFLTAKALTALAVSVAIAAVFQLVVLRNPASRTLRLGVANLTFETLSYTILLQAFGRSVLSSDSEHRPTQTTFLRIERELRHRELKLQGEIFNLMPLLTFATAEPHFAKPFRKDVFLSLIHSNQLVLDRLRETRAALGTNHFEDFIVTDFASILSPYRTRHRRAIRTQLYMTASSLQSKAPLPQDTPLRTLTDSDRANFIHDILVLSSRFAKTEDSKDPVRSREFVRYVSYLLGWTGLFEPLRTMEDVSKELLGKLESKLL